MSLSRRANKWPLTGNVFQDGFFRGKNSAESVKHVTFVGVKLTDLSLDLVSPPGRSGLGYMLSKVFLVSEI